MKEKISLHAIFTCERNPHGIVANVLNCNIIVSKSELQLCYYIHFGKGMNLFILPAMSK